MNGVWRARLGAPLARGSGAARARLACLALAAVVLLMPLRNTTPHFYHGLSGAQVIVVAFVGMAAGWVALDRLAAHRTAVARNALIAFWVAAAAAHVVFVSGSPNPGPGALVVAILGLAIAMGGLIRGTIDGRRSMAALVAIATATTWVAYDLSRLPVQPFRDIELYLKAGATALGGASPYITAPITSTADSVNLPFVYPPFTIPLFEVLASMARPLAIGLWEAASIAAVLIAMWLLGVRGRWLLVLLAWPTLSVGIAVGNVASFTFLLFVVGFRVGAALVLSGAFKLQSIIPSLWLVLERRWRELAAGVVTVAVLALISLPIVGVQTWLDWPTGLREFQASFVRFPNLQGSSLVRWHGPAVALGITVLAIGFAFLRRGRNSLARFGLASIVGSPTLYVHGLSPLLSGALTLGPEMLWFFLAFGPWPLPFHLQSAWIAMAIVGIALHISRGDDLGVPGDLTPSRADLHPIARSGRVWPDRPGGASIEPAGLPVRPPGSGLDGADPSGGSLLPDLPDPPGDIDVA